MEKRYETPLKQPQTTTLTAPGQANPSGPLLIQSGNEVQMINQGVLGMNQTMLQQQVV
jgi:hypothetical protein